MGNVLVTGRRSMFFVILLQSLRVYRGVASGVEL